MKLNLPTYSRIASLCIASALLVVITSWQHKPTYRAGDNPYLTDTVPVKEKGVVRDLDKELEELHQAEIKMEAFRDKEWPKIAENIREELSKLDLEKIRLQTEMSLKSVDAEKINAVIENINFEKIAANIEEAIASAGNEIDKEEIRQELADAKAEIKREMKEIKKVNTEEVKKALREAQSEIRKNSEEVKISLMEAEKEIKKALQEIRVDEKEINRSMAEAKKEIGEARIMLKGYQQLIYGLEADNLLDTKKDYTIDYKDGVLKINDKIMEQPVLDKYKKYLGDKNLRIRKESGDIDINNRFD